MDALSYVFALFFGVLCACASDDLPVGSPSQDELECGDYGQDREEKAFLISIETPSSWTFDIHAIKTYSSGALPEDVRVFAKDLLMQRFQDIPDKENLEGIDIMIQIFSSNLEKNYPDLSSHYRPGDIVCWAVTRNVGFLYILLLREGRIVYEWRYGWSSAGVS